MNLCYALMNVIKMSKKSMIEVGHLSMSVTQRPAFSRG